LAGTLQIENFPRFWDKVDALIADERLIAPIEVLNEMKKRSDELHAHLKARPSMFRELNDAIQIEPRRCWRSSPALWENESCAHRLTLS
jgi:hypothetical protein